MRAMIFACLLLCGCKSLMTPQQQEAAMNTCHKHHLGSSVSEEFDNFFLWGDYGVVAIHCYPKGD